MPEHVHLLIWPTQSTYKIDGVLSTLKQSVAKTALPFVHARTPEFLSQMEDRQPNGDVHYRFWQRGPGFDRNLEQPAEIWAEINYMHANPIERGLCQNSTDWVWSSAIEYESPARGLIRIDRESLPRTPQG